jgi:DNA-binding NtrC family response regulator
MKKLCIIDDDKCDAILLKEMLQDKFDITTINPSKSILKSLSIDYDIYIVDINMGAINGFDVIKYIPDGKRIYMISGMTKDYLKIVRDSLKDKVINVFNKSELPSQICQII